MRDLELAITDADDATLRRLSEVIELCECPGSWKVDYHPEGSDRVRRFEMLIQDVDDDTVRRVHAVLAIAFKDAAPVEWTLKIGPRPLFATATADRLKADLAMPVFVPIVSSSQLRSDEPGCTITIPVDADADRKARCRAIAEGFGWEVSESHGL